MQRPSPEALAMIERFISFDTTSHLSNLNLIEYVRGFLKDHGIEATLLHNEDGKKANLFATIGPEVDGGIVLSGHTDVVPVEGQAWDTDPFSVAEKDGRLYGRGTSDMKSFSAIALAKIPELAKMELAQPIHLALSYDEEVGCVGVQSLIEMLAGHKVRPRAVIVGEPTDMKVVNTHKGIRSYRTEIKGLEAHSSQQHMGVSAIVIAARLIGLLEEIAAEMRERGDASGQFDPGYTTTQIGTIEGGTAVNIIPKDCNFGWEYRCLPDQDEEEILNRFNAFADTLVAEMIKMSPDCSIITSQIARAPGLRIDVGSEAETLALALAQQNDTFAVSYGTEAGLFQDIDIPTVVCGPGSIDQAHRPNEFIELEQIALCEAFMDRLFDVVRA